MKFAGDVLKKFDDKILLNHQISKLEQMAQALFNWFVVFEPVKAKIAAVPWKRSGSQADVTLAAMTAISGKKMRMRWRFFERKHHERMPEVKAAAELFPSVMQGHGGEIPEGWQLIVLLQSCNSSLWKST